MRPLARWTMGKVAKNGWDVLSESIRLFPRVYPEFDLVVCYNNLSYDELIKLKSFGVPVHEQKSCQAEFPFNSSTDPKSKSFAWKLVPTRLHPNCHELWIDNDIVIRRRIPEIDMWLSFEDSAIISYGYNPDYGRFINSIASCHTFCAGLFGLPPGFDFKSQIVKYCDGLPLYGFDEQGLVSLIVSEMSHIVIAPQNLDMFGMWAGPNRIRQITENVHFARANQPGKRHEPWRYYKLTTIP